MTTIVGVRPSGKLHLGHYASVIKPALERNADVLVARYHSPTGDYLDTMSQLRSYGLDPFSQAVDVGLLFRLMEVTPSHLLNAMPQYKAKEKTALMYCYPVLMAHDIVGYDYVVVGEDQRPHIEFARDILPRLGLKAPEPIYDSGKIMDLRVPTRKMSKSDPSTCLFLDDVDYEKKIMKAVTDTAGRENLESIHRLLGGTDIPPDNKTLKLELIKLYEKNFKQD